MDLAALIISCVSAIAATASVMISFYSTRPNLEVKLGDPREQVYFSYGENNIAILTLRITNSSMIGGTIDDIYISFDGKKYYPETFSMNYEIKNAELAITSDGIKKDADAERLRLPIFVPGFSAVFGYCLFPNFSVPVHRSVIGADVVVSFVDKKMIFKRRKMKTFHKFPFIYKNPEKCYGDEYETCENN